MKTSFIRALSQQQSPALNKRLKSVSHPNAVVLDLWSPVAPWDIPCSNRAVTKEQWLLFFPVYNFTRCFGDLWTNS